MMEPMEDPILLEPEDRQGAPLVPPLHEMHYAVPFDVGGEMDEGKFQPRTVGQRNFLCYPFVMLIA